MKKISNFLVPLFILYLCSSCLGHEVSAVAKEEGQGIWLTSYQDALEQSKKQNKPILMDFTGSDWCYWCIRLKKEVFNQNSFHVFSEKNFILLKIDFPKSKNQNEDLKKQNRFLANKFKVSGFPTVILMDQNEKIISRTGYREGGVQAYLEHLSVLIKK